MISKHIDENDIQNASQNGRCESFKNFYAKLKEKTKGSDLHI